MEHIVNMDYRFDGDIIITDPCYLFGEYENWWNPGIYGVCASTIYGDWSASVFDTDTNEKLGDFCADAGQVCVCYADRQVMDTIKRRNLGEWCYTLIKDFHGTVQIHHENKVCKVIGRGSVNFIGLQTGF